MKKRINLDSEIEHKINRYFYKIYHQDEIEFPYCVIVLNSENTMISFGKTREKFEITCPLFQKYYDYIEKIDSHYTSAVKKLAFNTEESEKIKKDIMELIPKEYHDNHVLLVSAYGYGMIEVLLVNLDDIDLSTNRVEDYLKERGYELDKETVYKFEIHRYPKSNMIEVHLNGDCIYGGNNWDFHNGCNGCDIPDFNGADSYVKVLKNGLRTKGYKVESETITFDSYWGE